MKSKRSVLIFFVCVIAVLVYQFLGNGIDNSFSYDQKTLYSDDIKSVIDYDGVNKYVVINNNEPNFLEEDLVTWEYEFYSDLDSLGRCGVAMANIGIGLMPTEERGTIGSVKPSGWHTVKYDFISGKYLYNRCHLIGYQLTGENANNKNLITCTRETNTGIMLEYENMVAKYVKETNNHVLYRVTPIFKGDNLVASGIEMEGYSVEDNGAGIKFHIYVYNVQDGIKINYLNGESEES